MTNDLADRPTARTDTETTPRGAAPTVDAARSRATLPHSVGSTPVSASTPTDDEVRASYDALHQDGAFESPPGFLSFLFDALDTRPGHRLLDIGCGHGELLAEAAKRDLRISGVDISPAAVSTARSALPRADLRTGSGCALPWPDGSFDRVTCIGTLEHLPDPEAGAREIARVLADDGRALVYVPNTYYWLAIARTILRGEGHDEGQIIQRHGARNEWRDLLTRSGLEVTAVRTWRYPIRLRPFRPRILLGALIERVVPENLLLAFAYVVRRP